MTRISQFGRICVCRVTGAHLAIVRRRIGAALSLAEAAGDSHVRKGVVSVINSALEHRRRGTPTADECRPYGPLLFSRIYSHAPTGAAIACRPCGPVGKARRFLTRMTHASVRAFAFIVTLIAASLLGMSQSRPALPQASLILTNGRIWTGNQKQPWGRGVHRGVQLRAAGRDCG